MSASMNTSGVDFRISTSTPKDLTTTRDLETSQRSSFDIKRTVHTRKDTQDGTMSIPVDSKEAFAAWFEKELKTNDVTVVHLYRGTW